MNQIIVDMVIAHSDYVSTVVLVDKTVQILAVIIQEQNHVVLV